MAAKPTTQTRIAGDIAETAAAVAVHEHRSAAEQVNHWARIGMHIERAASLNTRRMLAAADGTGQFAELTVEERETAHALVDTAIAERVVAADFGGAARAGGQTTVSLNEDGQLVQIAPDGTRTRL